MIQTSQRQVDPSFALRSELCDAANEHGYRIGPEMAAGWLFFRSASAPGEIAVAASGMVGPFFLSVEHEGVARELVADRAEPAARRHAAAFAFPTRDGLFAGVSTAYRLSISLPTAPLEMFEKELGFLGGTEVEAIVRRRVGQDVFRAALMAYWNGCCPITGIDDPALLRASHIVPWANCASDAERLDVHNGILLSSLWDAAFDDGLVSFGDDGRLLVSSRLGVAARVSLDTQRVSPLMFTGEQRERLAWHRANLFQP